MAARELNAVELDERVLLDLAHSTDPVGVLSIDAYPRVPDPGSRSWTIDRDNRLAELKPKGSELSLDTAARVTPVAGAAAAGPLADANGIAAFLRW
jgi:hypothetical protein